MTPDVTAAQERTLSWHLGEKQAAMREAAANRPTAELWREEISARCVADDLTGTRKWRIRDWNYIGDGGAAIGGWDLGPSSPELLLGVVSTCLTHTYLCLAAAQGLPLERVEVTVTALNNDARFFGVDSDEPFVPYDITATVDILAPLLDGSQIEAFIEEGQRVCPIVHLLRTPNTVTVRQLERTVS